MSSETPDELRKRLIDLVELSRRPDLSDGARALIALQMSTMQAQLDDLVDNRN